MGMLSSRTKQSCCLSGWLGLQPGSLSLKASFGKMRCSLRSSDSIFFWRPCRRRFWTRLWTRWRTCRKILLTRCWMLVFWRLTPCLTRRRWMFSSSPSHWLARSRPRWWPTCWLTVPLAWNSPSCSTTCSCDICLWLCRLCSGSRSPVTSKPNGVEAVWPGFQVAFSSSRGPDGHLGSWLPESLQVVCGKLVQDGSPIISSAVPGPLGQAATPSAVQGPLGQAATSPSMFPASGNQAVSFIILSQSLVIRCFHHRPSQAGGWLPSCLFSSSFCFSVTRTL